MKSLTYIEIDVDRCANTFGATPCAAVIQAGLDAGIYDNFDPSPASLNGWVPLGAGHGTLTAGVGGAVFAESGSSTDQYLERSAISPTFDGSVYNQVVIDIEQTVARTTGAWMGRFTFASGATSFFVTFANPFATSGARQLVVIDMSANANWAGLDAIDRIDFNLGNPSSNATYKIHSIRVTVPGKGFKCFNSLKTCVDRIHLTPQIETLRFSMASMHYPIDIDAIPNLVGISFSPATISLGEDLGQRATFTATFVDMPHPDTGPGGDRYLSDRAYDPYKQGTFWGKFRARYPYLQGRPMRVYRGIVGQTLDEMDLRYYIIDSFDGPSTDGSYTLVAKDVLKLADDDRSQAPNLSPGFLSADITATDGIVILNPSGVKSQYPDTGYANIGGSEIVQYGPVTALLDANTSLLLHADGADGSTGIVDSSANSFVPTRSGSTQLDTSQFRFGLSSILFDGSGDFFTYGAQTAFVLGTGDFTLHWFWEPNVNGTLQYLYDCRPSSTNGLYPTVYRETDNKIKFLVSNAVQISSVSTVQTGAFTHIALVRKSGVTKLFINGTQEGGDYADTNNYIVGASRPIIGASGNATGTGNLNGWIDELHLIKGVAAWSANFIPPQAPIQSSTDALNIVRGQFNTPADSHSSQDRFQWCLQYISETPADIIYALMTTYAAIPPDYINLSAWQAECANYLQRSYTTILAEPVGVNTLVSELIEQAALAMWWDDSQKTIALRVLRSIAPDVQLLDEENLNAGSVTIKEQPDLRVSQVWTYYALINPLVDLTETSNYRSVELATAEQIEADYGSPAIKQIFSRWIPEFGRSIATRLNQFILGRYQNAPRLVNFESHGPISDYLLLGGGYNMQFRTLQDEQGARETVPLMVTRLNPDSLKYQVEAQEALFLQLAAADFNNRTIIIDVDAFDFNLKTVHDSIFPPFTDPTGITITCIIQSGIVVGNDQSLQTLVTSGFAFDVGDFPSGTDITIQMDGDIRAGGGHGGDIRRVGTSGAPDGSTNGQIGGNGLKTTIAIKIKDTTGRTIASGGGGSGGVISSGFAFGGCGGAGSKVGPGGDTSAANGYTAKTNGPPGTLLLGGVYSPGTPGGGDPGAAGVDATGLGGAPGVAITGLSHITYTNLTPTVVGTTV